MSLQKVSDSIVDVNPTEITKCDKGPFSDIADAMESPEFRKLFDKYSKHKIEMDTLVMFMYLYKEIDNRWPELDKYQKAEIMRLAMKDRECRSIILSEFKKLT